jgi:hypothetical protein
VSCCGKARSQVQRKIAPRRTGIASGAAPVAAAPSSLPSPGAAVYFRYYGNTGLTVTGPSSSRVYRFSPNGAPIAVDVRDAASLSRVPNLRAVRHS